MASKRSPTDSINKARQEQILQEEIYRRDIRLVLEKQDTRPTWKQKILHFVNTPFFLWFCSAVVLGGIVHLYTQHTEISKEREMNRVAIHKLDTEIKSRLYYVARQLDPQRLENSNVSDVLLSMEKPSLERYPINVFPEYEKRNMRSLLWELHTLVPEKEKVEIESALNAAFDLRDMYDRYLELNQKPLPSDNLYLPALKNGTLEGEVKATSKVTGKLTSLLDIMKLIIKKDLETVPLEFKPLDLDRWGKPFTIHWIKQKTPDTTKKGTPAGS